MGIIRCSKCGMTYTCNCHIIYLDGKPYCKPCAIHIYKNKNNNNTIIKPQNTHLYNVKIIRNKQ